MVRCVRLLGLSFAVALALVGCKKPEEKLAGHIEAIGDIVRDNTDSPKEGVEEAREYLHKNLPEMLELIGEMAAELDKIDDPGERAERAKEMSSALESAIKGSQMSALQFAMKLSEDKEAQAYLEKWGESWEGVGDALEMDSPLALFGKRKEVQADTTEIGLQSLENAILIYRAQFGAYPQTLDALLSAPNGSAIIEKVPFDPWGSPYVLEKAEGGLKLFSRGPDGEAGTDDDIVRHVAE